MGRENLVAGFSVDMAAGVFRVPAAGSAQVVTRELGGSSFVMESVDMAAGSLSVGGAGSSPVRSDMNTGRTRVPGGAFHL